MPTAGPARHGPRRGWLAAVVEQAGTAERVGERGVDRRAPPLPLLAASRTTPAAAIPAGAATASPAIPAGTAIPASAAIPAGAGTASPAIPAGTAARAAIPASAA